MTTQTSGRETRPGDGYRPSESNPLKTRMRRILTGKASFEDRYFPKHEEAIQTLTEIRNSECRVVFTSGVWDLFHIGHAEYMLRAREEAAKLYPSAEQIVLVVGVDTDELTKQRKGPDRPVVPMSERCKVLAHLRWVDMIVPQYEANQLYCELPYDVRVISTSTSDLPEMKELGRYCEHLVNLPPQADTTTTGVIRKLTLEGKQEGQLEMVTRVEAGLTQLLQQVRDELGRK
jgi:cytidyltransferase-like protein